jgi:hypothetical protein
LLEFENFHVLGRTLYFVPYCAPLHPGRVLPVFAILSTVVEVLNALGVSRSLVATTSSAVTAGHNLVKAALIMQIFVAILLISLAAWFHRRCSAEGVRSKRVIIPLATLYTSMGLITIRTIFRVVEYFVIADTAAHLNLNQPLDGLSPLVRYEWFFYVFEAAPMLLVCVLFNVMHPRRFLPQRYTTYLGKDGVSECEGPGWNDKRPFIVTLCDPFDIIGALTNKSKVGKEFWEQNPPEAEAGGNGHNGTPANMARAV